MFYAVTDRDDKDRKDPIVDVFFTREQAQSFANEWTVTGGAYQIEEFETVEDVEWARTASQGVED